MTIENYELLELVAEDKERETFKARDVTSSKNVILHRFLPSRADDPRELSRLVKALIISGQSAELLFAGERDGRMCIVIEPGPDCYEVRRWLESRIQAAAAARPKPDAEVQPPPPEVQPLPQEPPPSPKPDPGDFTRYFKSPPPLTPPDPSERVPAPPPAPPPHEEPGDFTRMFQLKDIQMPAKEDPGEFTRMFKAPPPKEPEVRHSVPMELPKTSASQEADFSRIFSVPVAPPEPKPPSALPPRDSNPAAPVIPPPAAPPQEAGPGEFTRVIMPTRPKPLDAPAPQPEEPKPSSPPPAPIQAKPASKPSYLPLFLILGGLLVAALALILFFVFRR